MERVRIETEKPYDVLIRGTSYNDVMFGADEKKGLVSTVAGGIGSETASASLRPLPPAEPAGPLTGEVPGPPKIC